MLSKLISSSARGENRSKKEKSTCSYIYIRKRDERKRKKNSREPQINEEKEEKKKSNVTEELTSINVAVLQADAFLRRSSPPLVALGKIHAYRKQPIRRHAAKFSCRRGEG